MNSINMREGENNIQHSLYPQSATVPLISNTPTRKHTRAQTNTLASTWDPFVFLFIRFNTFLRAMCDIGCTEAKKKKRQNEKAEARDRQERDLRREGERRRNETQKERSKQSTQREWQSRSEDEESRCSLHPPATSLILAVKRDKYKQW